MLDAISPPAFRARLHAMTEQDRSIRVLSWILGPDRFLEWGHTLGVISDHALGSFLPPLPPPELRAITAAPDEAEFLWTGLFDVGTVLDLWTRFRPPLHGPKTRVLDFGGGCGRLTRFLDLHAGITAFATDVNADLVEWSRAALRRTRVTHNSPTPPLDYGAASFDLVVSLSVFTHLPPEPTMLWIKEIARLLAPGGVLVLTVHGLTALDTIARSVEHQRMFRMDLERVGAVRAELAATGFAFLPYEPDVLGLAKAGDDYGNSFADGGCLAAWGSPFLELVEHLPGGLRGWQDMIVLRKPG